MKSIRVLLIGSVAGLLMLLVPTLSQAYYDADTGHIEMLAPSETQQLQSGGGETPYVRTTPSYFSNDASAYGRIEMLAPSETPNMQTGGGEILYVRTAPSQFSNDAAASGHLEMLAPSESPSE